MAEELAKSSQYDYRSNSNLVLQSDRSGFERRDTEIPEVGSLYGKIDPREFGSRVERDKPHSLKTKTNKKRLSRPAVALDENLTYYPRTHETEAIYGLVLSLVSSRHLPDQSQQVVRSVVDEALGILRNDSKDVDRKSALEKLLALDGSSPSLTTSDYSQLLSLASRLDDYGLSETQQSGLTEEDILGVTVVFNEDENEEEEEEEQEEEIEQSVSVVSSEVPVKQTERTKSGLEVNYKDVDAFWIQRILSPYYKDAYECFEKAQEIWSIITETHSNAIECENRLVSLLSLENFDIIKLLVSNRKSIFYGTRLSRSSESLEDQEEILSEMYADPDAPLATDMLEQISEPDIEIIVPQEESNFFEESTVDLDSLAHAQGSHTMTNARCVLPPTSWRKTYTGYEEIHVPAPEPVPFDAQALFSVKRLPEWMHPALIGIGTSLNRLQSRIAPYALGSDEPLLVCAPTGSGKTLIALLAILRLFGIESEKNGATGNKKSKFMVVYIAPMKALVHEVAMNFSKRLAPYSLRVEELTGDTSLETAVLVDVDMVVTTPEKWDVITRKGNTGLTRRVKLVVVDEIHMLHDTRGPVLEAVVSRSRWQAQLYGDDLRIVALSATLPNYEDVARWLGVGSEGLFVFGPEWRPTPLAATYIGITERKAFKRQGLLGSICFEQVKCRISAGQILIFVHSRAETGRTGRMLRDAATESGSLGLFSPIAEEELIEIRDGTLKELLVFGIGIHHAGLYVGDRRTVESLFERGRISVLVSTATLAWGVNLPAHTVIVKGTQIYSADKGGWIEIAPQDVLQMFGRAGRPSFDTFGEAVLITGHKELQFYMSLSTNQLPIESQMVAAFPEHLNAEVVRGRVASISDAMTWFDSLYLSVRLSAAPVVYLKGMMEMHGSSSSVAVVGDSIVGFKMIVLMAAARELEKAGLLRVIGRGGDARFEATLLGRVASKYYVRWRTMALFGAGLRPESGVEAVLGLFEKADEFSRLRVREEEKAEMMRLVDMVPYPTGIESKVSALLQATVSDIALDGLALSADLIHVSQNAVRLLRAMGDVAIERGWPMASRSLLGLARAAERHAWRAASPLRQFLGRQVSLGDGRSIAVASLLTPEILNRLERRAVSVDTLRHLTSAELGEWVKRDKLGRPLACLVKSLPKLDVSVRILPLSPTELGLKIILTPDWIWDEGLHGYGPERFVLWIEDFDEEKILTVQRVSIWKSTVGKERTIDREGNGMGHSLCLYLVVPMLEPLPPAYFVSIVCEKWHHCDVRIPVDLTKLVVPVASAAVATPQLDLAAIHCSRSNVDWQPLWPDIQILNPIQTQLFRFLSEESIFLGAPHGSGRSLIVDIAILGFLAEKKQDGILIVSPHACRLEILLKRLSKLEDPIVLSSCLRNDMVDQSIRVGMLEGIDFAMDIRRYTECNIVLSTPAVLERISRRCKKAKIGFGLVVVRDLDSIHSFPAEAVALEVWLSRFRAGSVGDKIVNSTRFVVAGTALNSAISVAEWLDIPTSRVFQFLETSIHLEHEKSEFVSARIISLVTETTAGIIVSVYDIHDIDSIADDLKAAGLNVVFHSELDSEEDRNSSRNLFSQQIAHVLIAERGKTQYELSGLWCSLVVVISGEDDYVDDFVDIRWITGRATKGSSPRVVIFSPKRIDIGAVPFESALGDAVGEGLVADLASGGLKTRQDCVDWLTWTFLYRRIAANPNFYGVEGRTHRHLSEGLSELVETAIDGLTGGGLVVLEDEEIQAQSLAVIAGFYGLLPSTVSMISKSMKSSTRMKGIFEILSAAVVLEFQPRLRRGEWDEYDKCRSTLPLRMEVIDTEEERLRCKIHSQLQMYLSRDGSLGIGMQEGRIMAKRVPRVLHAIVDVAASQAMLNPALSAMDLCQMFMQGVWATDALGQVSVLHSRSDLRDAVLGCWKDRGQEPSTMYDLLE